MSAEYQARQSGETENKAQRNKQMKRTARKRFFSDCVVVLVASALSALGFHVFVYPAKFAPGGMDGVATMLQEVTHINAGWYSLILNLPLLVAAYFVLKRRYVIITVSFTVLNALFLIVLEKTGFYQYHAETDRLLPAIFSGILLGARGGMLLKAGASTGGVDIVACMVQRKRPYLNVERIIAV
ncbi:MAG: YitT family protein, partial [Candidatus Scatosoma sp.]